MCWMCEQPFHKGMVWYSERTCHFQLSLRRNRTHHFLYPVSSRFHTMSQNPSSRSSDILLFMRFNRIKAVWERIIMFLLVYSTTKSLLHMSKKENNNKKTFFPPLSFTLPTLLYMAWAMVVIQIILDNYLVQSNASHVNVDLGRKYLFLSFSDSWLRCHLMDFPPREFYTYTEWCCMTKGIHLTRVWGPLVKCVGFIGSFSINKRRTETESQRWLITQTHAGVD